MRYLINLFLILYLADGGVSLLDEVFKQFFDLYILSGIRNFFAVSTLVVALPVYGGMGIDRRVPKRILIPMIVYIYWCLFGLWPLFTAASGGLPASGFQLLFGVLGMGFFSRLNEKGAGFVTRETLKGPFFSLTNTTLFFSGNLIVLPLVMLIVGGVAFSGFVHEKTSGFVRLSMDGIYLKETVYRQDEKEIRLTGMIHIGDADYYKGLTETAFPNASVILAEGISDREKLLKKRFSYGRIARFLNLSSQENMQIAGNVVDLDSLLDNGPEMAASPGGSAHIVRADVDVTEFQQETVDFLNAMASYLTGEDNLAEGFKAYNDWLNRNMTPEMAEVLKKDIIDLRNSFVIRALDRALVKYSTIVVPWGAMHMPEIEAAVLERGFVPQASRERLSIDFSKIPVAEIMDAVISGNAGEIKE